MPVNKIKPPFIISIRFMCVILLFFGYAFNFMQKIDMGIAIVCMTNHTAIKLQNGHAELSMTHNSEPSVTDNCPAGVITEKQYHDGEFVWTEKVKGLILSAYFYGYIFMQIPGGWLSFRFGGQIVLFFTMLIGSCMTLLIPTFARIGPIAHFIGLFMTGFSHGAFWPSVSSFWAYWAPPGERSRMVGISSMGSRMGNVFALGISGYLCVDGFAGGWPSIFYTFGSLGIIWIFIFMALTTNTPSSHRWISEQEKAYILEETRKSIETRDLVRSRVPWGKILKSKACWAVFVAHFTTNWGGYLFMTQMPSYLRDVLRFDIKSNGVIASIPYLVSLGFMLIFSVFSDKLLSMNKLSKKNVRRFFILIGITMPCIFIIGLSFVTCEHVEIGVGLLVLGIGFDSILTSAGYLVNINDIAGPFSGIVFGISNTIATIPGLISPYLASVLTSHQTQKEWQRVFLLTAGIYLIGGSICLFLLEATTQHWAEAKPEITQTQEQHQKL